MEIPNVRYEAGESMRLEGRVFLAWIGIRVWLFTIQHPGAWLLIIGGYTYFLSGLGR